MVFYYRDFHMLLCNMTLHDEGSFEGPSEGPSEGPLKDLIPVESKSKLCGPIIYVNLPSSVNHKLIAFRVVLTRPGVREKGENADY